MDSLFDIDENEDDLLLSSGLFTNDQLRNILLTRKQFETKIRRKEKPAFFAYIEKEKQLLHKVTTIPTNSEASKKIILRIIRLHKIGLSFFKEDLKLWLSYIKFCTEIGNVEAVNESFPLMLKVHTEKRLWHLAAKWELTQFNDHEKALSYLYRGLHFNPTAPCLYTHIYKLELAAPNYEYEKDNTLDLTERQKIAESKASNIFEMASKVISDLEPYTEMLKITTEYTYITFLHVKISTFLITKFSNNETAWNLLAQRELEGYHLTEENNYKFITDIDNRVQNCVKKYKIALEKLPTKLLWEKYLNMLVDLYERYKDNNFVRESFMSACEIAHNKSYMSEKHYLVWLESLKDSPKLTSILEFATKNNPQYVQLWVARIRHHFTKRENHLIEAIFTEAINALGDNSIQIWRRKLQFYQLKGENTNNIEKIFRSGLDFSTKVSLELQPQFLEWVALFRSRDVVHEIYKELSKRKPFCVELHKKMAELEAMCSKPNGEIYQAIKNCINENSADKGEWDEYICQEIHYGPTWRKDIYKQYLSSD